MRWQYFATVVPNTPSPAEAQLFVESLKNTGVAPAYSWLVQMIKRAGIQDWSAVRWPNFILGALAPVGVFWLAKQIFSSRLAGWWAAIFVLTSPWYWHWSTTGLPVFSALLLGGAAFGLLWSQTKSWIREISAILLLIAAISLWLPIIWLSPVLLLPILRRDDWLVRISLGLELSLAASVPFFIWRSTPLSSLVPDWANFNLNQAVEQVSEAVTWQSLVSLGSDPIWLHMPNTGFLNGMTLIAATLLLPFWLLQTWRKQETSTFWAWGSLFLWSLLLIALPGLPAELTALFWLSITLFAAYVIPLFWQKFQNSGQDWATWLLGGVTVFVLVWQTALWVFPLQVRWQYYMSPLWYQDFLATLHEVPSDHRGPLVVVGDETTLRWYFELNQLERADAAAHSPVQFVSQAPDFLEPSSILLQPRSNAEWDMIEP